MYFNEQRYCMYTIYVNSLKSLTTHVFSILTTVYTLNCTLIHIVCIVQYLQ